MPELVSFVDTAAESPGFLLPLFRWSHGDNTDLAQVVDHNDSVDKFVEITPPGRLLLYTKQKVSIELGELALWAFKDHKSQIHLGTVNEMVAIASALLRNEGMFAWPMARLELGSFRDTKQPDVELMQAAFRSVLDDSGTTAAEVWRDTELFAPAIRRDIRRWDMHRPSTVQQVYVFYDGQLNVLVEAPSVSPYEGMDWRETNFVLDAFGLSGTTIKIRPFSELTLSPSKKGSTWTMYGIGGVARHVLLAESFQGLLHGSHGPYGPVVRAQGSLSIKSDLISISSQFIAVCQSVHGQANFVACEVDRFPPEGFIRHLVNVRPFNFGSPPPRKTPVFELPNIARNFDHIWIIAGHRQRRTGRFRNQFSVTNAASRHVRALLKSLIRRADLSTTITREGLNAIPSLNLFGMIRPEKHWSDEDSLRNLLRTMLCEEALLHTAKRIFVLKPNEQRSRTTEVRLGRHRYSLELVPDAGRYRSKDLIGWAITAELPGRAKEDFKDFCVSLMDGYHWDFRGSDGVHEEALLFEDEGEAIRIWPVQETTDLLKLISHPAEYGRHGDVILTNQSTPDDLLRKADEADWTLIHYSELPQWLRANYSSGRFSDSESL